MSDRSIGSISISVVAKTDRLVKNLDTAGGKLKQFSGVFGGIGANVQSQVDRMTAGIGKLASLPKAFTNMKASGDLGKVAMIGLAGATVAVVAAAAAAATALGHLAAAQAPLIDANAKLAARADTTYNSLIALQHVASLGGVDVNSLGESLTKLGVKLTEANKEAGPAYEALSQLGLSAKDLAKKDRVEAFADIADAISKIKNPADQAAVATKLFEENGAKMLGIFKGIKPNLAAAGEEMKVFGLALDSVQTKKVEDMNDAITRMHKALDGIGTTVLIATADSVTEIVKAFTNLYTIGNHLLSQVPTLSGNFKVFGDALKTIVSPFGMIGSAAKQFNETMVAMGYAVKAPDKGLEDLKAGAAAAADEVRGDLVPNVKVLNDKLDEAKATFGLTASQIEIYKLASQGASDASLQHAAKVAGEIEIMTRLQAANEAVMKDYQKFDLEVSKVDKSLAMMGTLTEEQKQGVIALRSAMQRGLGKEEIENAKTELEKYNEAVAAVKEKLSRGAFGEDVEIENLRKLKQEFMAPLTDITDTAYDKLRKQLFDLRGQLGELPEGLRKAAEEKISKQALGIEDTADVQLQQRTDAILEALKNNKITEQTAKLGIAQARQGLGTSSMTAANEFGSAAALSQENRTRLQKRDPLVDINLEQLQVQKETRDALMRQAQKQGGIPEDALRG